MADHDSLSKQEEIERLLAGTSTDQSAGDSGTGSPRPPAVSNGPLDQSEIEALLDSVGSQPSKPSAEPAGSPRTSEGLSASEGDESTKASGEDGPEPHAQRAGRPDASSEPSPKQKPRGLLAGEGDLPQADVEYLLSQAQEALNSIESPPEGASPPGVTAFRLAEFGGTPANSEIATLDLIRDVELDLKIELGRTHMYLEDVLKLRRGSVVPLDKLAGEPVDIYVNGRLIARGEVLVLNDNFCVRVAELIAGSGPND